MARVKRSTRNIRWVEAHCRIPEGKDVGKPVRLRPWQKAIFRQLYDTPTRRLIFSVGRKNAKTALSSFIVLLHTVGPEARKNGQLYSAAQSQDQASIVFSLAAKMVRMSDTLSPYVVVRDTVKEIACPEIGTLYKALSAEASTALGKSPVLIIHDELGQVRGPRSRLYEALETAVAAQEAPLSIIISTQAATDDDLLSVLIDDAKTGADPRTKLVLHTAPLDEDPFAAATIKKANPAFGDFQNAEEVLAMAEDARRMPSREPEFRNLVLNQRVEVNEPYVTPSIWKACGGPVEPWPDGTLVYAGLDLSASSDLTAFVRVGWVDQALHVRCTFWLPGEGLAERARKDRVPYDLWRDQGHLVATPGRTVDYDWVAPLVLSAMKSENIKEIAFDAWNFRFFKPALERAEASEEDLERFTEMRQGFQTMSPALRALDTVLLNGNLRHGNHPVLSMCAANAVVKSDPADNRKLDKMASNRRIDGMVALAMAVASAGDPQEVEDKATAFSADYRMFA